MGADRGEAMRQTRRLDGQRKRTLVLAAAEAALQQGHVLTIAGIARNAGVGRKFVYDHPDLRAEIELKAAQLAQRQAHDMIATARVTGASLRADLENNRAQNRRLQQQLRSLENRLSELEGARLVADELLPTDVVMQLADRQLAQRVTELERRLFETEEALRQATEELDAARAVNRQLMHRANRTDAKRSSAGPLRRSASDGP
jgi:chromosome segregation ATPase